MQQDLYNKYLQHLGLSEDYKRMKEASANNPGLISAMGKKSMRIKRKHTIIKSKWINNILRIMAQCHMTITWICKKTTPE
ncbi:hypothetical protein [Bacillus sp. V59.32b]|uniref:hypothetical protein n=1 Tax=Bacillus sp. V59.32b TaxID=1758642 RepID=UPI000E3CAC43|nr:hypothetical protein [Bacillus sp. V59.32b]RFU60690.1 hypothetical protein D0463_16450 [Bacillus sp. V59.32b]